MRSRALSALDAMAHFHNHFDAKARLLKAAEIEIRTLAPDAARQGPDYTLLITEAQTIDPEDLEPADARKLARLKPSDPWVEVIHLDDLLATLGQDEPGDLPEATLAPLRPGVRQAPPSGTVRCVVITGNVFECFVAEITPVASATRGRAS